eukprot:GILI01064368.1.p1 GENE.GILI01064368.1~~GILI01064368.1.p1  ORF type:complete len:108 (+),score=1.63 GILI01064368.1:23-346(+)
MKQGLSFPNSMSLRHVDEDREIAIIEKQEAYVNANCASHDMTYSQYNRVVEALGYREPFDEVSERLQLSQNGERLEKSAFHVPNDWKSKSDEQLTLHLRQRNAIKPL